jgi:hypothetical protein
MGGPHPHRVDPLTEKPGMHPDSQSLESSFEPALGRGDSDSSTAAPDPVVEDFNAFFERLSALDQLQWSAASPAAVDAPARPAPPAGASGPAGAAAPTSAAGAAASAPATRAGRRAAAQRQGAAGRPRMTVVKSDTDLGAAPPAALPDPEEVRAVARGRITARDVARFLKLTLVGLMLFALGLGAGWAALSLPGRFDDTGANFAELMERTRAMALPRAGVAPSGGPAADRLRLVESGAAPTARAAGDPAPAAKDTAQAAKDTAPAAPVTATGVQDPAPAAGMASAADPAANDTGEPETGFVMPGPQAPAAPGARPARVAATATAAAPPAASAEGTGAARFTLQVGACSSFACVENYRHLLLAQVRPGAIKVVAQPGAAGGPAIQRIRVQPLERGEAERLKAALAAQDPHFADAYVLALR